MSKRNIVLLFDGTASDNRSDTNIHKIQNALAWSNDKDIPQRSFYYEGVGVRWFEKTLGGMFGLKITEKILSAYEDLRKAYRPGDQVYVFGFSRGAFTAQAFLGFCAWCGLLKENSTINIEELFDRYLEGARPTQEDAFSKLDNVTENSCLEEKYERTLGREQLVRLKNEGKCISETADNLLEQTHDDFNVKFLGVFDTVRTAGMETFIPRKWRNEREINGKGIIVRRRLPGTLTCRYTRHIPPIVERAYQALAIDEHRSAFENRVWIIPKGSQYEPRYVPDFAEQRWFSGAHANIGGGYKKNDELNLHAFNWMIKKAKSAGLSFDEEFIPVGDYFERENIVDSYKRFAFYVYRWVSRKRYYRPVMAYKLGDEIDKPISKHSRLNETLDVSVIELINNDSKYRPINVRNAIQNLLKESGGKMNSDTKMALDKLNACRKTGFFQDIKNWILPGTSKRWPCG